MSCPRPLTPTVAGRVLEGVAGGVDRGEARSRPHPADRRDPMTARCFAGSYASSVELGRYLSWARPSHRERAVHSARARRVASRMSWVVAVRVLELREGRVRGCRQARVLVRSADAAEPDS